MVDAALTPQARAWVAYIKETGTTGIAFLMVVFFLGQQAGWIPNVDRQDHKALLEETQAQSVVLKDSQRLMRQSLEQASANQEAFVKLARVTCMSAAKTHDIQQWCLGVDPK